MRKALLGFESEYEGFKARQEALAAEKEEAKAAACAKVDAEFASREAIYVDVLNRLSEEVPDPVPESEQKITENVECYVDPVNEFANIQ